MSCNQDHAHMVDLIDTLHEKIRDLRKQIWLYRIAVAFMLLFYVLEWIYLEGGGRP